MAELNVWTDGIHREVARSMDDIRAYRLLHGVVTEVNIIFYENNSVGLDITIKRNSCYIVPIIKWYY